jgi:hypothetical protein
MKFSLPTLKERIAAAKAEATDDDKPKINLPALLSN